MSDRIVIGIDGGGTRLRAAIATSRGELLGYWRSRLGKLSRRRSLASPNKHRLGGHESLDARINTSAARRRNFSRLR